MKNALILHGTDGSPELIWIPWLRQKLEAKGYDVWAPLLPENHTPNRQVYNDFLFGSGHDFTDNILIGHSSGAVEVLNLLDDERLSHIRMAVMVSPWAGGKPNGYDTNEQFENLFPAEGYEFVAMRAKAGKIAFLHGDNDPYCPLEQAQFLAGQLDAPLTVIPNGGHLGKQFTELPELWQIIEPNL
ncbi:MAG TPA: alpha/beta hydrolase [Candidatus Saccharimonadales bacterium]|nr:alpha/beta hydrolase [Candidatus Saccharimonadales bacterium]